MYIVASSPPQKVHLCMWHPQGPADQAMMVLCTGAKSFFKGVGPRALSNGLNSGIFFCFFELLKQVGISEHLCHLLMLTQFSAKYITWTQSLSASSCKQSLLPCNEDLACGHRTMLTYKAKSCPTGAITCDAGVDQEAAGASGP